MWEGIFLGGLTFIGLLLIWKKFPKPIKSLVVFFQLPVDIIVTALAYIGLTKVSSSFGTAVGCAIVGICVSAGLSLYQKRRTFEKVNEKQHARATS